MARKRDNLLLAVNNNADPWVRLQLAIVIRAVWDTEAVIQGNYGYGIPNPRELLDFWRSEWAGELTEYADTGEYIKELEYLI